MQKKNKKPKVKKADLAAAIKDLRWQRTGYIEAEIKVESGVDGFLRRIGLPLFGKRESQAYFLRARAEYWTSLKRFREALLGYIRGRGRNLLEDSVESMYRLTVVDEIERVKIEKENKRRKAGWKGFLRESFQDYREFLPTHKMLAGGLILFLLLGFYLWGLEDLLMWQLAFTVFGIMLFLEGLQQQVNLRRALKKGITRGQIYRQALRNFGRGTANLGERLQKVYQKLDEEIWRIRCFEKRGEYARYIFSVLGGMVLGAVAVYPFGIWISLEVFVLSGFLYLVFCLLMPFGLINQILRKREDKYYVVEKYPEEDVNI